MIFKVNVISHIGGKKYRRFKSNIGKHRVNGNSVDDCDELKKLKGNKFLFAFYHFSGDSEEKYPLKRIKINDHSLKKESNLRKQQVMHEENKIIQHVFNKF